MKVAVIGAGFTGLTASYILGKEKIDVTVFEKDQEPGGLAIGYQKREWDWSLEKHYHHWFTNDHAVLKLATEIGHEVLVRRPKTSTFVRGEITQLDSPITALKFNLLPFVDKFRMLATLAALRYNPFWKMLEGFTTSSVLPKSMGSKAYRMIWEPLLQNKFGPFTNDISLAWFWARVVKRTTDLAYPSGGFLSFAKRLEQAAKKHKVRFSYDTRVENLEEKDGVILTICKEKGKPHKEHFDKVIVTLPSFAFTQIAKGLPSSYIKSLLTLRGIGAMNLVLRLKKPFFTDSTYWLNICETNSPIMAVVEHTNFMDPIHYNNEHLVYLGNYLPHDDPRFALEKDAVFKLYKPFLTKLNPKIMESLINIDLFKAPFAQPIIPVNYSKSVPPHTTPLHSVYLANMQQVYPWDRGTNYAVELGEKVANMILLSV